MTGDYQEPELTPIAHKADLLINQWLETPQTQRIDRARKRSFWDSARLIGSIADAESFRDDLTRYPEKGERVMVIGGQDREELLAAFWQALSHPIRLRVLEQLRQEGLLNVGELVEHNARAFPSCGRRYPQDDATPS